MVVFAMQIVMLVSMMVMVVLVLMLVMVALASLQTLLHLVSHPPVPPLLTCTNLTDDDNPSISKGLENTSKGCHFANIIGSAWSSLHLIAGW